MASRINPVPLMALIILVIITLVLTILIINKSGDVRRIREGDPERPSYRHIEKLKNEVKDKENRIREAQKTIAMQKAELYRLDLQGNVRRLYYDDGLLLGGVATPGNEQAEIRGQTVKLKESSWKLTSELIANDVKYMEGLRTEYEGPERQTFPALDEAIKRRQDQLRDVLKTISEQDAAFNTDKERLTTQLDSLTAERDKIDKKARDDVGTRLTHINHLEDRIRELLELDLHWMVDRDKNGVILGKAGLEKEGLVMQVDNQSSKLIIDQGQRDRIVPGLLFEVFNYDRGVYVDKGKVEVIEVQERISVCRVLHLTDSKHNPIGRGDYIGNPVFNARKPKVFVVAGEFRRYNKEDLETFIRNTGGIVWPQLAPGADFLVAGERSDIEQAAARQYQILAMHEDDLLEYVQTTFAPKMAAKSPEPVTK